MGELLPRRRLVRGAACMLFAACWLLARLIAPAAAMPVSQADAVALAALQTLCHGGGADSPADPAPVHTDCLLCPACHLMAQAAIPAPGPILNPPTLLLTGLSAALPPATGPTPRRRAAAQPTGPPTPSV